MFRRIFLPVACLVVVGSLVTATPAQNIVNLARPTNLVGGGGGSAQDARCLPGEYLTLMGTAKHRYGPALRGIRIFCSRPPLNRWNDPTVTATALTRRGAIGVHEGFADEYYSNPNAVGCSNGGAIHSLSVGLTGGRSYVQRLRARCLTDDGVSIQGGVAGSTQGLDGFENVACPPGERAVGIHGRTGDVVDAIGLLCAQISSTDSIQGQAKIPDNTRPHRLKNPFPGGATPKQ